MARSFKNDLDERTFRFACDVFDYCDDLVRVPGLQRRVGYQLFDAAGSIGANRHESKSAYSRRDFTAKNALTLKEAREAAYWLCICEAKRLGNEQRRSKLLTEV